MEISAAAFTSSSTSSGRISDRSVLSAFKRVPGNIPERMQQLYFLIVTANKFKYRWNANNNYFCLIFTRCWICSILECLSWSAFSLMAGKNYFSRGRACVTHAVVYLWYDTSQSCYNLLSTDCRQLLVRITCWTTFTNRIGILTFWSKGTTVNFLSSFQTQGQNDSPTHSFDSLGIS